MQSKFLAWGGLGLRHGYLLALAVFTLWVSPSLWQMEHWGWLCGVWGMLLLSLVWLIPRRLAKMWGLYPLLLVLWWTLLLPLGQTCLLTFWKYDYYQHWHTQPAARVALLRQTGPTGLQMETTLHASGDGRYMLRFWTDDNYFASLRYSSQPKVSPNSAPQASFHSPPFVLPAPGQPWTEQVLISGPGPNWPVDWRAASALEEQRSQMHWRLPDGQSVNALAPLFRPAEDKLNPQALIEVASGLKVLPNPAIAAFQRQNAAGQWVDDPLEPGFSQWAGWDAWQRWVKKEKWGAWWQPLLLQAGWSLLLAITAVTLAALSATAFVACLIRLQRPRLGLYTLVLPAAVPLALLAFSMQLLFRSNGEINLLLQLLTNRIPEWHWPGPAHASLLLAAWWWLSPLFCLWFWVLGQGRRAWPGWQVAGPGLLLSFASLLALPTLIECFTRGGPRHISYSLDYDNFFYGGYTDTLASLSYQLINYRGMGLSVASCVLLLVLPVLLALSHWRVRLLRKIENKIFLPKSNPQPARWALLGVILGVVLHSLPLVAVAVTSFRTGNFYPLNGNFTSFAQWLGPEHLSLQHWYHVFGQNWMYPDGELSRPDFPVLRWLANSWGIAALHTLLALGVAQLAVRSLLTAPENWSLRLRHFLLYLQGVFPALLVMALLTQTFALQAYTAKDFTMPFYLICTLAAVVMLVEPLYKHARAGTSFRQIWLTLGLLTLWLQLGEYPLASMMLYTEDNQLITSGSARVLMPNMFLRGDFAAMFWLYCLPLMGLLALLIPRLERHTVQHWRP